MDGDPRRYSRVLVVAGLVPLLLLDVTVGLPDGAFVGGGSFVLVAAAGVHFYGGQRRAGAGWLALAASLVVLALVDVTADVFYLVAFLALLGAGLLLLASQRLTGRTDE